MADRGHFPKITGVNEQEGYIVISQSFGFADQKMVISWEDAQELDLNAPLISVQPK